MILKEAHISPAYEGAVGEDGKYHVFYFGYGFQNIGAGQRLASSQEGEIDSQGSGLSEDCLPLLRLQRFAGWRAFVRGYTIGTGIASLAMKVAGGCYAADEKRRNLNAFLVQDCLPALLRTGEEPLHTPGEPCLPWIGKHILVSLGHDVTYAAAHIVGQIDFGHHIRFVPHDNNDYF